MNRHSKTIIISLAITLIAMQGAETAVKTPVIFKEAGRAAAQTPNTILSGSGVPAKSIGINGDFYIDIKNANLYGPKTKGVWKVATSLKAPVSKNKVTPVSGPAGAVGAIGAKGATGDRGLTGATGATGNTGAKGETGLTGAAGLIGPAGANGTQGISGAVGAKGESGLNGGQGATGATGANGVAGAAGAAGAAGLAGSNGTPGLNGAAGVKGDTGLTGAAGISTAKFSSIAFTGYLAGSVGSTKSSESFGTFAAGKSYIVRLLINTYDANSSVFTYGLGMALTSSGDNPVISSSYSVAYGSIYSGGNKSTVSIIADVVLNGASTTNPYSLIVTLTSGANGSASISASGVSTQILVGTIG